MTSTNPKTAEQLATEREERKAQGRLACKAFANTAKDELGLVEFCTNAPDGYTIRFSIFVSKDTPDGLVSDSAIAKKPEPGVPMPGTPTPLTPSNP